MATKIFLVLSRNWEYDDQGYYSQGFGSDVKARGLKDFHTIKEVEVE